MAEHQVLVELGAVLAVEVDVEQLAVPQRLGDAVHEVEVRHLLVADLGVDAEQLGVLQVVDERERVPDGRAAGCRRAARWAWARWRTAGRSRCPRSTARSGPDPRGSGRARPGRPWPTSYSAPSRPPHSTNVFAPSSAARSMLRSTLRSAYRRTDRSLLVKPPSLNTGWVNRLVVTIGTTMPVSSSAFLKPAMMPSRVCASEPNGTRSSSWNVMPYAPSSASLCTASTGSSGGPGRVAERVTGLPPDGPQAEGELVLARGLDRHGHLRSQAAVFVRPILSRRRGVRWNWGLRPYGPILTGRFRLPRPKTR